MAKQNEVTAASMKRRAKEHRVYAAMHRRLQREPGHPSGQHAACAMMHRDSGKILDAEAKEIRSHR